MNIRRSYRIGRLVGEVAFINRLVFFTATATAATGILFFFLLYFLFDCHRDVINDDGIKNIVIDRTDIEILAEKVINYG